MEQNVLRIAHHCHSQPAVAVQVVENGQNCSSSSACVEPDNHVESSYSCCTTGV